MVPNFSLSTFSIIFSIIFSRRDCSSCDGDSELCFSFLEIGIDAEGGFLYLLPYETCESLISSSARR